MRRLTRVTAALAAASALMLGGCGVEKAVVGIHDAPTEDTSGAPISATSAEQITQRVLRQAAEARAATGKSAEELRKKALTGPALANVSVHARFRADAGEEVAAVEMSTEPTVLAVSRSRAWPRAILATTLDEANVQRLHVLTSQSATEPFKLFASVSMQPGAKVPAVSAIEDGAPLVTDGKGLAGSPAKVLQAYAAALAYPKPKKSDLVSTEDAFAETLRANAKKQKKALDDLATFTREHKASDDVIAFQLADGSALMFGRMKRTDTIKATDEAKELTLPKDLAKLVGEEKAENKVTIVTHETVAMTIPESGAAQLVAVDEQRAKVSGS